MKYRSSETVDAVQVDYANIDLEELTPFLKAASLFNPIQWDETSSRIKYRYCFAGQETVQEVKHGEWLVMGTGGCFVSVYSDASFKRQYAVAGASEVVG